jgi:YD repeat-containing protein
VAITLTYDDQGRVRTRTDARGQTTGISSTLDYVQASEGSLTTVEQGAQSGGGTPPLSSVTTAVKSGQPGGPAVVVGDPADPVPTPVCVPEPPTGDNLRSGIQWSTGSSARDPRLDLATMFGSASRPNGGVTRDAFHRTLSWSDATGGNWQIKLDDEDQFTAIQSPSGEQATITYDETGNVVAQYEYDDRGDLRRATLQQAGGAMSGAQYWFDGLHRIRRIERYPHWPDLADAQRIDFGYGSDGACSAASS